MKTIQADVPDEVVAMAREAAARANQSLDQFVASAIVKQVSLSNRILTIEERAKKADRNAFRAVLDRVPKVPPLPGDELKS